MQRAACCRLPVSGRRGAQVLLDSERHSCQIYLAARCRNPLCRCLSKFSCLQGGNIQISYLQDSPWLSWSASPLVAFWLAVAQAKPGLATILAITQVWIPDFNIGAAPAKMTRDQVVQIRMGHDEIWPGC